MKPCPHCGAELRDNARFCTACMTPLNEKRMVPKWIFFPHRWLSVAAAVLALVCAVAVFPRTAPPMDISSYHSSISTAPPLFGDSTSTAADEIYPEVAPPHTETNGRPGNIHIYQPDSDGDATTEPYDWEVGKGTARNTDTISRTTNKKDTSTTTTTKSTTTTTTTKTTRATAAVPTYPAVWDAQAVYYTEEGEAFEEVEWTYKPYWSDTFSYSPIIALTYYITKTCRYSIPLSQCIVVTGFDAPTANGYYRIPPAIDGKVVLGVNMSTAVSGACQFNDAAIAPTVKRITFPTEMLFLSKSTIDQCTNLERLYFDCDKLYMEPKALPQGDSYTSFKDLLRVYGNPDMLYDYDPNTSWWMPNYCELNYDKSSGAYYRGYPIRYYNVCHYYTEDLYYWNQLYPK